MTPTVASLSIVVSLVGLSLHACAPVVLPYDQSNPLIYDNDSHEDMYTDELILALDTLGRIDLRGIVTTNGGWSDPFVDASFIAAHAHAGRAELIAKARRSGMRTDAMPVLGAAAALERPVSGRIEDTMPLETPAARLIVEQARSATPQRPLVIVTGGPPTTIADALLIEPSIADHIVVAWTAQPGENEFNSNPPFRWAAEIVVRNTTVVLFPLSAWPVVKKSDLKRLPNTELRQYMIDKALPHVQLPGNMDGDAAPVIPIIRSDFVRTVVRQRWTGRREDGGAVFADDPNGNVWKVTRVNRRASTDAWWRTMTDSRGWGGHPVAARPSPFGGRPATIPGRIEAEAFDDGGLGVAYGMKHRKSISNVQHAPMQIFRVLEHVDLDKTDDAGNGYHVMSSDETGEWLSYTVDVTSTGMYAVDARVAAAQPGGTLTIRIGDSSLARVTVPPTDGSQAWQTVRANGLHLSAGRQILRLNLSGGLNVNWIEWTYERG